jgi:Flp pilus assembly secretin CpaC
MLLLVSVCLCLVDWALSEDAPRETPAVREAAAPAPSPRIRPAPPAPVTIIPRSKVDHLREAARHLEAAGYTEDADEFRSMAESLLSTSVDLLRQKEAEVARLHREIAELREITGMHDRIQLTCRIIEVSRARLRDLGLHQDGDTAQWASFASTEPSSSGFNASHPPQQVCKLIDLLRERGAAKVLAEPVLVTTAGRTACLVSGGEFPVPVPAAGGKFEIEFRAFGVKLEATPEVLGDSRLRVDLVAEVSERDFTTSAHVQGIDVPGLTTRRVSTQMEMRFGETVVVGGLVNRRPIGDGQEDGADAPEGSSCEENELLILVTPEPVSAAPAIPTPAAAPREPHRIPAPPGERFSTDPEPEFNFDVLKITR